MLWDVTLTIRAGERVALMGRSGAGKSTLIGLIHAQAAPDISLIPQQAALVRQLSVFHNVYMGRLDRRSTWHNLRTLAVPARADVAEVRTILEAVDLSDRLFARAGELSGGQQQRVAVARALYGGRPILVGDEPVSALDRRQGGAVLARLAERHETLILALHDIPLALDHMDRIVLLESGRIALDAPTRDLDARTLARFYDPAP